MGFGWQSTPEDVSKVLEAHSVKKTEAEILEILKGLNQNEIEREALRWIFIEDQTIAALSTIEDMLMEAGIIPKGEKKWN